MIEVLVALVILAVGLLGMAGVTMIVMRGGKGAEDLANVTNICQQKIEELKNLDWTQLGNALTTDLYDQQYTLGLQSQSMIQKTELNAQGLTAEELCNQQSLVTNAACWNQAAGCAPPRSVSSPCEDFLVKAGPYKYTVTFDVCDGLNFGSGNPPVIPAGSGEGANAKVNLFKYSAAPNCEVKPGLGNEDTRPLALACDPNDILTPGNGVPDVSPEKMIRILCTWRSKEGICHYVNFRSLRVNNL